MTQILSVLNSLKEKLEVVAPRTAEWEARMMILAVTGQSWADLYAGDGELRSEEEKLLEEFAVRRLAGEPLAYVLGTAPFRERELSVGPGVLIPRIETELLVEAALEAARTDLADKDPVLTLDLGTGTGCIALAVAEAEPRIRVDAVELSTEALRYAKVNTAASPACARVRIIPMDYLKEPWSGKLKPQYHLILANPPYVSQLDWSALPPEVQAEPHRALVSGPNGDEILKWIITHARAHLTVGGFMILEIGIDQSESLVQYAKTFPDLCYDKIIPDHQSIPRILVLKKNMM
jgi:release factor glutamine methyltransferase